MRRLLVTVALASLAGVAGFASAQTSQSTNGVVRGSAFDQSKARIPGVQIILSNQGAEVKRTVTDENGDYSMEAPAGTYGLMAQLPGFDTSINVVQMTQSETLQNDITMVPKPIQPRLVATLKRSGAGAASTGLNGKWETERPDATANGIGSERRGQNFQAEFSVEGDKVTGTLAIGGLGGTFYVIRDGKRVGNQIQFQTTVTSDRYGRPLQGTATTSWTVQLVDESTIQLRSLSEIDNGVFIAAPR